MINKLFSNQPEAHVILEVREPTEIDAVAGRTGRRVFVGFPEMETFKAAILASLGFHISFVQ